MDDPRVFGPVVYELSLTDAITRGLLAHYQVVVAELTNPVVTPVRLYSEERPDPCESDSRNKTPLSMSSTITVYS
ncbi:hypothetical protein [Streptomyces sp. AB3(2024)]|uniref:hypothetical protein n=1 Tax=Streptomyces sp. AB3(2024) TaxID=3317321 RepID=UPI0035A35B33